MQQHYNVSYSYNGTFEGLLCVVFDAFAHKREPVSIATSVTSMPDLFVENLQIKTDDARAERVWQGLIKHSSARNARLVYMAYLSELPGIEMLLWRYLKKIFTSSHNFFYQNMLDDDVMQMAQTVRKVQREMHRFLGLVRFQKTADGMFFAIIDPDHNILQLLGNHFRSRYASQPWIIYDTKRSYGIYYDLKQVQEVYIENPAIDMQSGRIDAPARDMDEDRFRKLWQTYYGSISISERANPRQMLRMMPRRYWKYLPEKDDSFSP